MDENRARITVMESERRISLCNIPSFSARKQWDSELLNGSPR
jgi:hypothetical protein